MPTKKKLTFADAYKMPIGDFVEKKGQFSYLSWAYAVKVLRENFPDATWTVHTSESGTPFFCSESGCFVHVTVTVDGIPFPQWHPILDHRNQPIAKPNCFQVNTSIQRCLAKAIATATGIGLGLYAGEDLPTEDIQPKPQKTKTAPNKKDIAPPSDMYIHLKTALEECESDKDCLGKWAELSKDEIATLPTMERESLRSIYREKMA